MRLFAAVLLLFICNLSAAGAGVVTLRDALSQAISNNASLLAAKADIAIADAEILRARLRLNPAMNLSGDHLDLLGTGFNDVNGGGPGEVAVGFEYTFQRGGKRARRIEVAQQTRSVTELRFEDAVRALVLDVEDAFIDALLTRDSIDLARQNLDFFRQIVEIDEARVKAGDIAEVELVRSRLAALQYETAVHQAEHKYRSALVKLQILMGRRRASSDFSVEGTLDRLDGAPLLDDLQKEAVERRPDLQALRRDVQRARSELALQQASAKQDWTIGTDYRRQQENARANALTLSLNVPLAIFDRNQGGIARAHEEQRQAELRVRALEAEIAGDVETAWSKFMTARALLATIRGAMLQSAREVRDVTEFSYRRGEANLLALLDAQRAFNETMQGYIEARAEYARSQYELDHACGRESLP
jgi:outer membrane protein, heavy metal efflux system